MALTVVRYLRLDALARAVAGAVLYRGACWRCYWSPPRVGHPWAAGSHSLEATCSRCPKRWIGNL